MTHGSSRVLAVSNAADLNLDALSAELRSHHLELIQVDDHEAAREWIADEGLPHLVIIDLEPSTASGLALAEELYQIASMPIIIVLDSNNDSPDVVLAALKYADDVVRRQYASSEELGMRIIRVLSRIQNFSYASGMQIEVTHWLSVNHIKRELVVNGVTRTLTPTENALLGVLLAHRGTVVDADTLIERVWQLDPSNKDRNALRVHMHRLRTKIEADSKKPLLIMTARGNGYLLADN
jgi:two-component system, OmpR family, response regulator RegX3